MIKTDPSNTVYNAKRFIGLGYSHSNVEGQRESQGFSVIDTSTSPPPSHLPPTHTPTSTASFSLPSVPHPVSPEEIGSSIITHLLHLAHTHLGHTQVKSAVIAVPAKFTSPQRAATALAFKMSGLKVTRIMEEPTAAALAYGLHRKPGVDHVLVYDYGGGTLDVSVLHVSDGYVEVVGSSGDDLLGGGDFDVLIGREIWEGLRERERVGGGRARECEGERRGEIPWCTKEDVVGMAERIKIGFSGWDGEEDSRPSQSCLSLPSPGSCVPVETKVEMDMETYERVISPLLSRSFFPVANVLAELDLETEAIDEVVMVGGTSRMPQVRELVRKGMNIDRLNTEIDPDVTVAYGCASIID